jgi:hypothetical protein
VRSVFNTDARWHPARQVVDLRPLSGLNLTKIARIGTKNSLTGTDFRSTLPRFLVREAQISESVEGLFGSPRSQNRVWRVGIFCLTALRFIQVADDALKT